MLLSKFLQFEDALNEADPKEGICKLVDPKLGDDYPLDSVWNVRKEYVSRPQLVWDLRYTLN